MRQWSGIEPTQAKVSWLLYISKREKPIRYRMRRLDDYVCDDTRHMTRRHSQQTQNICITFVQRRPNVFDVDPTFYKCYTNGLCLLDSVHNNTSGSILADRISWLTLSPFCSTTIVSNTFLLNYQVTVIGKKCVVWFQYLQMCGVILNWYE